MTDADRPRQPTGSGEGGLPLDSTSELLRRVRAGDGRARDDLFGRFLPILQTWARGRLPTTARNLAETDDVVQVTVIRALRQVEAFEPRREGAFLAYLRTILLNVVREEIRRASRHPQDPLGEVGNVPDQRPTVDAADAFELYESALSQLSARQREAVILRLEFGYGYAEIAEAVECASPDAARMIVNRALARVAETMSALEPPSPA